MNAQRYAARAVRLVCVAALGCVRSSGHEEDDHLEHHVPEHKPASLAIAIEEIERRFTELAGNRQGPNAETAVQLEQLVDIVRWLPEIAGDSDLPEAPWNEVDRVSQRLWPPLQEQADRARRGESFDLVSLPSQVTESVKQLRDASRELPAASTAAGPNGEESTYD